MKEKVVNKLIAAITVICLFMSYVSILTDSVYAAYEELEKQGIVSNNKNVEFDAYFKTEGTNKHSMKAEMTAEQKLYVRVNVKNTGYLETATISLENPNFAISKNFVKTDDIKSVDYEKNQITLNQIESGKEIELEIPINFVRNDNMDLTYFSRETKLNLEGTYYDENGKSKNIKSNINVRLNWNAEPKAVLNEEVTKYGVYNTNVYVQTLLTSMLEGNSLPVEKTQIEVTVPKIADKNPTEVRIFANTMATNSAEFTKDMWSYNKDTGILKINLENKENNNLVNWKLGEDKFYITYIYADTTFAPTVVTLNAKSRINTYVTKEEVTAEVQKNVELNDKISTVVDSEVSSTEEIYKGYMYANNKYETQFASTISANIAYIDAVDKLELIENNAKFITANEATMPVGNNMYYKNIAISKAVFDKILGPNGIIQIYDQNGNKIAGIDKNTNIDANSNMTISINSQDVTAIKIETTKPVSEGIITFNINKAIKATTNLNRATITSIQRMDTEVFGNIIRDDIVEELETKVATTKLNETSTKAELYINNVNLTTTAKNENVEIKAILKSNDYTCDLFENPTLEITLPSEIEVLEIKTINLLYNENLAISSYDVITDANGNKVIRIRIQGNQTEFVTDISKGINVVINTDITLRKTAANVAKEAILKVTNNKAIQYENDGIAKVGMNIYAPQGVVLLSSVANFSNDNAEVVSLPNKEQAGKIGIKEASKNITMKATVVNNYGKDIKNPKILGRIPFQGNKKTDGTELGSTVNTILTSGLTVSGIENGVATIYYSENGEATADLNNTQNGWKQTIDDVSKIKSYLVVLNNYVMPQATAFDMAYNVQVPENLSHNENAFGTYTVYYEEEESNQTISKETMAPTVGVSTGKGPELKAEISSNIGSTASTEDIMEYKITVKNDGEVPAENVKVTVNLPEIVDYAEYIKEPMGERYEVKPEMRTFDLTVGNLEVQESKEVKFTIKANKEGKFKLDLSLSAGNLEKSEQVSTPEVNVTLASFIIQFTTPTQDNVGLGSKIEYYTNITNATDKKIENVKATIKLPDNVEYIEAFRQEYAGANQSKEDVKYDEKSKTVTFNVGDIEAKSAAKYNFILRVKTTKEEDVNMQVVVKGKGTNEQRSSIIIHSTGNNKLEIKTETDITKDYLQIGDVVTYTITAKNVSSGVIKNVRIKATIPDNLKYLNTTYYVDDKEMFSGYLLENKVSEATLDLDAGQTFKFVVKAAVNKMIDTSKEEEDATVDVEVSGDGTEDFKEEINNKIENDNVQNANTYRISGVVWFDENRNGTRDLEEKLLEGIPVTIVDAETGKEVKNSNGSKITATTNNKGEYILSDLIKGKYIVKFNYDNSKYVITEYRKQDADEKYNSDAINTTENNGVAITDSLEITENSMNNIDLGLTTKGIFDLSLNKSLTQIKMADGKKTKAIPYENKKLGKIEVDAKRINNTNLVIEYTMTITNKGNVAGYAKKIVDYLPKELEFSSNLNKDWYTSGETLVCTALENELIKPGETKEVKLLLTKKMNENATGTVTNKAEITETYNDQGLLDEKNAEDDANSSANVIIGIKTGGPVTYAVLTLTILAIAGCGAYIINKKVLKI